MKYKDAEILKIFQTEENRKIEEDFASMLSENPNLRLFFINENQAYTDGKNIVVDPASDGLFKDKLALENTEKYLEVPHIISKDSFIALKMVTRVQTIHETLHIIYSNFPPDFLKDSRGTNKFNEMILSSISNIIEDCFIENAGASEFDNMRLFLVFGRVSRLYSNTPSKGTTSRNFEEFIKKNEDEKLSDDEIKKREQVCLLLEYIDYFATMLLYPMVKLNKPSDKLKEYVEKTRELWLEGSICGDPDKRYEYTSKIFDIIMPLIPEIEDNDIEKKYEKVKKYLESLVVDEKTHSGKEISINKYTSKGKNAKITRRLFVDLEGKEIKENLKEQYMAIVTKFTEEKGNTLDVLMIITKQWEYTGEDLKANAIHKDIKIKVEYPKPNINMKRAYDNIYNKYRLNINFYNSKFKQLLKGNVDIKENKFVFGQEIDSKNLGDIKRRYWYRKKQDIDVPDIAILFLIDGSGSMEYGDKKENAMIASLIVHEVLDKNKIEHAIVEHRAIYDEPLVKHNILVDFKPVKNDKYNILKLDAKDGTREGLSLMWAKKYILESSYAENKIIICISDGLPEHNDYWPPISTKDTHNTARKIESEGIKVIGVAIEDMVGKTCCYDALKECYDRVIDVDDVKHLTSQLLKLISKLLV